MTGLIIGVPVVRRLCEMRDICVFYSQRLPALKNATAGLFASKVFIS
jgi:hypothetical protein